MKTTSAFWSLDPVPLIRFHSVAWLGSFGWYGSGATIHLPSGSGLRAFATAWKYTTARSRSQCCAMVICCVASAASTVRHSVQLSASGCTCCRSRAASCTPTATVTLIQTRARDALTRARKFGRVCHSAQHGADVSCHQRERSRTRGACSRDMTSVAVTSQMQ